MKPLQLPLFVRTFIQFMGQLGLILTQFLVILIFIWSTLRFYPGEQWVIIRWIGFAAPWIFLALIPALFIFFIQKKHYWSSLIILLLFGGLWQYAPVLLPDYPAVKANTHTFTLRVMTYNINISNRDVESIKKLVELESPDVIAIQELTEEFAAILRPQLASSYPYYLLDTSWPLPIALMSRYPLTPQPVPDTAYRVQHALIETPAGIVTIWNVHPLAALVRDWDAQHETMLAVAQAVAKQAGPILVLGDFNSTPQNETYYLIADKLIDVHWAVGQGFSFTLPDYSQNRTPDSPPLAQTLLRFGPVARSDHIFVSNHFIPLETHVVISSAGSDHRPVVATLALEK